MKCEHRNKPPYLANLLLRRLSLYEDKHTILGDLEETYQRMTKKEGIIKSNCWYWAQVLRSFPRYVELLTTVSIIMMKNYLKIAIRNFSKHKVHSAINILGLAVGLMCTILIFLFVQDELSFDRFHENLDQIYRLTRTIYHPDGSISGRNGGVTIPHGPAMKDFFPEVKAFSRHRDIQLIVGHENGISHETVTCVDEQFFEMFSFRLLKGDPESVLTHPNGLVLTESYAQKCFGSEDPLGKTLTLTGRRHRSDFTVTGITKDPPANSTITFNILMPFERVRLFAFDRLFTRFTGFGFTTYIQVEDAVYAQHIIEKYPAFTDQYYSATIEAIRSSSRFRDAEDQIAPFSFGLQKFADVHFDPEVTGHLNYNPLLVLIGIALVILFIACVNFMILSVGRASTRSIEIGMRKVMGAEKRQLIRQFWSESIVMTGLAMLLGMMLVSLTLPTFNTLSEKTLHLSQLWSVSNLIFFLGLVLVVGICAGLYPALVMSEFKPIEILKGRLTLKGNQRLTQCLVILQFTLSISLIISTIILSRQVHFMIRRYPGFNREGVVVMRPRTEQDTRLLRLLGDRLKYHKDIIHVSGSNTMLGTERSGISIGIESAGDVTWVNHISVDYDYFKTLGIEFTDGRDFSRMHSTDSSCAIINESLARVLKIEDPVGKPLEGITMPTFGPELTQSPAPTIIGVVKDVNVRSLRFEANPAYHVLGNISTIYIRIRQRGVTQTIDILRSVWKDLEPNRPFSYSFLEDDLKAQYQDENRWNVIVRWSSMIAILISCMGIFGLTSLTFNRRIKEIGVRKVLGASIPEIVLLLLKRIILWVMIANIIAWPIAFFAMQRWLQNFAYRIEITMGIFILSAVLTMGIALLTVSYQSIRAALADPIEALRYE